MPAPPELHEIKEFSPIEVKVTGSLEGAIRQWKAIIQKEKVISLYKEKTSYEKPSDKKRRKKREAVERTRIATLRQSQMNSGEWDKKQKRREQKRKQRQQKRETLEE